MAGAFSSPWLALGKQSAAHSHCPADVESAAPLFKLDPYTRVQFVWFCALDPVALPVAHPSADAGLAHAASLQRCSMVILSGGSLFAYLILIVFHDLTLSGMRFWPTRRRTLLRMHS